jgi:[ribosomal protein S18]-alanine N-acetyltransferase
VCAEAARKGHPPVVCACRREDLPAIHEFLIGAPEAAGWSMEGLVESFERHPANLLVVRKDEEIAGFIAGRRVLDEGEILSLAVGAKFRRSGIGRLLVQAMLEALTSEGAIRIFLEVRESNVGAIAFYEKLGFQRVGRRKNYYQDTGEAALEMAFAGSLSWKAP